jgi:hypothetical protein
VAHRRRVAHVDPIKECSASQAVTAATDDAVVRHVPGVDATNDGVGEHSSAALAYACATCGVILDGDPDEDPTGDAGRPICGECERSHNFDAELQLMDEKDRR